MSTSPQLTPVAVESHSQTANPRGGPRTEEGKASSSKNATTFGLFASRDFIRPGEQALYSELAQSLQASLAPQGPLEQNLVDEIRRAMWRLQRCAQVEESFATSDPLQQDPMQQEDTSRLQLSVDRARSLSHRLLHKCTTELRTLQTERVFRNEFFDAGTDISDFGICDVKSIRKATDDRALAQLRRQKLTGIIELDAILNAPLPLSTPGSFCKTAPEARQAA